MAIHDTPAGRKIEGPQQTPKKVSKLEPLKLFLQNRYTKALLMAALLGGAGYAVYEVSNESPKDESKDKKEIVIQGTDPHPFDKHVIDFRDNDTAFFAEGLQSTKEILAPGVEIIRDAGLVFYVVQNDDIKEKKETIYVWEKQKVKKGKKTVIKKVKIPKLKTSVEADFDRIRDKLSNIPEFSYLKEPQYDRSNPNNKTKSFNVPRGSVTAGMYIPIPLDHNVREISPTDFANYCYDAIESMKKDSNSIYFKDIHDILAHGTEKELIATMLSFARSETAGEHSNFIEPLGDVELHRWEDGNKKTPINAFSFTYFHILMEYNENGTPGPGLKARQNLGLTEGQCYHPTNACKLFLAYRIEKIRQINLGRIAKNKENQKEGKPLLSLLKITDFLPLREANLAKAGKIYNGSAEYAGKLGANFEFSTKLLNGDITFYNDSVLEKHGFVHNGFNKEFNHMYKYTVPAGSQTVKDLKKKIVKLFNASKDASCPQIRDNNIVRKNGTAISDKILLKNGDSLYIIVPTE